MAKINKLKTLIMGNTKFHISRIGEDSFSIPEYGVIFNDGLTVACKFGYHSFAYAVGAVIYLATHGDKDKLSIIEENLSEAGVLVANDEPELEKVFSLFHVMENTTEKLKEFKNGDEPVATFINAKDEKVNPTHLVKEYAINWLKQHKKLVWAWRCIFLMIDDEDFWVENDKHTWNELMDEVGIRLPSIQELNSYRSSTPFGHRYHLPNHIIKLGESEKVMEEVFHTYPIIRELLGVKGYYASIWEYNFIEDDLDSLLFAEDEDDYKTPIKDFFTDFMKSKSSILLINDTKLGIKLELSRDKIKNVYFGRNDYVTIDFIAPKKLVLTNREYLKNDEVKAFLIDDLVEYKLK